MESAPMMLEHITLKLNARKWCAEKISPCTLRGKRSKQSFLFSSFHFISLNSNRCGAFEVPEGFANIPDISKNYPHCCVNLVRIEDLENIIE